MTVDIRVLKAGTCKVEGVILMGFLIDKAEDGLVPAVWIEAFNHDQQGPEWIDAWDCLTDQGLIELVGEDVRVVPPQP